MARNITYREALNEALTQEMERDETVIVMGEDNAGGAGAPGEDDAWGGVLGVTKGLYHKFPGRVLDTPISESAFIGAAIGAATAGMRPVAELMFVDFMGVCFDQIYNQAAKFRYMFGGKAVTPVVIRTMYGAGLRAAAQHSQCLYPLFTHIPGLKVVLPATPYDAKGLLIQAIRDNDPVMFFEHKALYDLSGPVPEESYALPFGEANVVRRAAMSRSSPWAGWCTPRSRRPASLPRTGCSARSSTCAPPARWTRTPCWRASRAPAGWSWSTRRTPAARSPPTSPRSSPGRHSVPCGPRSRW